MKLFYFIRQDRVENFGDSLNPWLWDKLLGDCLDEDEITAFIGIGTILNDLLPQRVPNARKYVVFSSGVGYEEKTTLKIDNNWTIYCVRGPLSAQKLGLSADYAVADGAILLRRIFQSTEPKEYQFSFMPHVEQAMLGDQLLQEGCTQAGIHYIDPRWPIEEILSLISRTEVLLAEAMHGAIAAEALRVPWIPIITSSRILHFKWSDWCASLNLDFQPAEIVPLVSRYPLANQPEYNQDWLDSLEQKESSYFQEIIKGQGQLIATQLIEITKTFSPNLSKERQIESLTTKLEERLFQLKSDLKAGKI